MTDYKFPIRVYDVAHGTTWEATGYNSDADGEIVAVGTTQEIERLRKIEAAAIRCYAKHKGTSPAMMLLRKALQIAGD